MKFRHTHQKQESEQFISKRGPGKNPDYDFLFDDGKDELPFNYRKEKIESVSTPAIDRYYEKIQMEKVISASNPTLSNLDKIAIAVTLVLMAFWTLVILALTFALQDFTVFLGVSTLLLGGWAFTWFSYYIGWRFYWIMIAIGWLISTGYALTVFGLLQKSFYELSRYLTSFYP